MLLALWHSPISPPADILITDVVNQVVSLHDNGLCVDLEFKGVQYFEVDVQLVVADLPGRAKISCLNGHSGFYACGNCLLEGIRCLHHQHTLYTWLHYSRIEPDLRTQYHIDACALQAELSGKKYYGVHRSSPLSRVLSIPDQCVYDYFHLIFEGHTIMLLKEWKLLLKQINIAYIDDLLNNVDYPHDFHRKPKNFNSFQQWKGSDLRTFFLYLALPLIIRLQPALSNKLIYHFSLILVYVRTLRYFQNHRQINHMKMFINEYLKMFSSIYGRCRELLSTHILVHLPQQCIRHGALSFHSMFPFESQLHYLRKLAHGTNSLAQQVAFWYTVDKRLNMTNKYTIDLLTLQQLRHDPFFDEDVRIRYQGKFRHAFYLFFDQTIDSSLEYASRLQFGIQLYHSLSYSRKKNTASYRICVPNRRYNQDISSTFSQRTSTHQENNYRRSRPATRYPDSPILSPSVKRKHGEVSVGETLILEKLDQITEKLMILDENNVGKMKKIMKTQDKTQKIVYRLAYGHKYTAVTIPPSSEQSEPVVSVKVLIRPFNKLSDVLQRFNGINLSEGADLEKRPTGFLCKLIRRLYTADEIEKGIVQDERITAIKESIRKSYYSDDQSNANENANDNNQAANNNVHN
ncbi:unnamed protein product [Rotaria sp. Silwood2]|nr:unnamed protein product [Rotaria sp. Silwood2]